MTSPAAMRAAKALKEKYCVGELEGPTDSTAYYPASDEQVAGIIEDNMGLRELATAAQNLTNFLALDGFEVPSAAALRAALARFNAVEE